ncbi:alpha/beta fold hydrolase [Ligilactobacillus sp. WILCCON 0076]|uniref:Alpha/beta fold hydrolase n=1 Tax=Ligilactobacillus ubinensis TaxID=2876789 RepID=A0A9X2FL82_9LACO|nr:alpha/beta fold hydrolase [Ligilactobacillus ubinensis]MCP0887719.1 alpha/beta fold hydrolase [Ligilactobacillus ubinensis]
MSIIVIEKAMATIPVLELIDDNLATQKLPLVVFYHGWTGCKEKVLTQGYELAKKGFRVVLPDALYHGKRQEGKTEEHQAEFWKIVVQSVKEFPDLIKAYERTIGYTKLGVSGLSMGGITTCALIASYDWIDAGVCLEGSPHPVKFANALLKVIPKANELPKEFVKEQLSSLDKYDLALQSEKINKRPLHFWHGTADEMVPYKLTKEFYDEIKDKPYAANVTFTTTQGAHHKVSYATTIEMADKFETYFK